MTRTAKRLINMHELVIAQNLLKLVLKTADEHNSKKIVSARLRAATFSCISPDTLRFSFEALAKGTAAENCAIEIERDEAAVECPNCGRSANIRDATDLLCQKCGMVLTTLTCDSSLTVESITVD